MLYAVLKIMGIVIVVFLFSVFTISIGVRIGLNAYFEDYREENKKKDKQDDYKHKNN